MHQQANNLSPEKLEMLHEVFQQLVRDHSAVSHHHRRHIAQRVIVAAREGFATAGELMEIVSGLDDHLVHGE